jgi:gas vesicle protein
MAERREFYLGLAIGSLVGAAVALLYAPASGEETRHQLADKATDVKDKATEVAGTVRTTVADKAGAVKETVTHAADSVRTRVTDVADRAQTAVSDTKTRIQSAVEAGKDAYASKKTELEADVAADVGGEFTADGGDALGGDSMNSDETVGTTDNTTTV